MGWNKVGFKVPAHPTPSMTVWFCAKRLSLLKKKKKKERKKMETDLCRVDGREYEEKRHQKVKWFAQGNIAHH